MKSERSAELFARALKVIPAGVNSPVRAFGSVREGGPFFVVKGAGARLYDIDGNSYLDFIGSWGPLLFGHVPEGMREVLDQAVQDGTSYGAATPGEVELAEMIVKLVPSVEMVRLVNSGTEATMTALRLARGATGRSRVIKFEGCYHGHSDSFLVKAGSGGATFGVPDSAGVPRELSALTINVPYNDPEAVERVLAAEGGNVAALIVEPVAGNMGVVPPAAGFLSSLRELTRKAGVLLIFDEVITGFRLAKGGAQERYGITPDLTCMGKIIGGGLPVGAVGGESDLMRKLSPLGPVYQAGTLSGNPLAVAAGLYMLKRLDNDPPYDYLESLATHLEKGIRANIDELGLDLTLNRVGSLLTLFFNPGPVIDWTSAARSDKNIFARYFNAMLERGVFVAPSQFEAAFVSAAMTVEDIDLAIRANRESLKSIY